MKRFRFNLEKVLELRRYEERRWELKLGEVTGRCVSINRRIKERTEDRRRIFEQRRLGGSEGFADFRAADRYAERMDQERQRLSRELESCEREREEVRQGFLEASRRRKVIERLKERKEQHYYRQQRKEEQKELDDIAGGRWTSSLEGTGQAEAL
jgi:flagellar FliJ protein